MTIDALSSLFIYGNEILLKNEKKKIKVTALPVYSCFLILFYQRSGCLLQNTSRKIYNS